MFKAKTKAKEREKDEPQPAAEAPVAPGYVRIRFTSLDERESHGVRDVPVDAREFRMSHNNTLYEQGRIEADGSWIYHDRGL